MAPNQAAAGGDLLFELPIDATNGKIVVTRPKDRVYLLTFTSGADNRLITVPTLAPSKQSLLC
jgi:hypothetical protein